MNIGHLGDLTTKTSKTSEKLVQRDHCMSYTTLLILRSRNCTDVGGKVANKWLSCFVVKMSG